MQHEGATTGVEWTTRSPMRPAGRKLSRQRCSSTRSGHPSGSARLHIQQLPERMVR
eukprot:CAMPEP_0185858066 /NCGR_PEP_ID=MMETSP1354-20130828/29826_1 /TAXON_ID=708628 /ORGANISM="Erythrolobus madagascarensis, Strain CCMP3276" /LENGTH=55 /DNA_ID=CAMNT_0028560345 /DNA_START=850 /DNA_END=1017 /DNA_ORIENTATION=+